MNQTLPPLHGGSLQITLTVVLRLKGLINIAMFLLLYSSISFPIHQTQFYKKKIFFYFLSEHRCNCIQGEVDKNCLHFNNPGAKYSDNQKTMEYKDDIIEILKRFDVVTKQICLLVT